MMRLIKINTTKQLADISPSHWHTRNSSAAFAAFSRIPTKCAMSKRPLRRQDSPQGLATQEGESASIELVPTILDTLDVDDCITSALRRGVCEQVHGRPDRESSQ
jgi:hypothetical protein